MSRTCNEMVTVTEGNVDYALKPMRKRLANGGVLWEMREREHAMSPGKARRVKHVRAVRKSRRRVVKAAQRDARDEMRGR